MTAIQQWVFTVGRKLPPPPPPPYELLAGVFGEDVGGVMTMDPPIELATASNVTFDELGWTVDSGVTTWSYSMDLVPYTGVGGNFPSGGIDMHFNVWMRPTMPDNVRLTVTLHSAITPPDTQIIVEARSAGPVSSQRVVVSIGLGGEAEVVDSNALPITVSMDVQVTITRDQCRIYIDGVPVVSNPIDVIPNYPQWFSTAPDEFVVTNVTLSGEYSEPSGAPFVSVDSLSIADYTYPNPGFVVDFVNAGSTGMPGTPVAWDIGTLSLGTDVTEWGPSYGSSKLLVPDTSETTIMAALVDNTIDDELYFSWTIQPYTSFMHSRVALGVWSHGFGPTPDLDQYMGGDPGFVTCWTSDGEMFSYGNGLEAAPEGFAIGDTVGILALNGTITFYKNGVSIGVSLDVGNANALRLFISTAPAIP